MTDRAVENKLAIDSSPSWRFRLRKEAMRGVGWTTSALGFTIPMWVVADGVLVVLLVVCWLVSGGWRERVQRVMASPVAVSALLLFGWLLIGTTWGLGTFEERMFAVKKYADLLLIPILVSMAVGLQSQHRAILALGSSLVVLLVLSLVLSFGTLQTGWIVGCDPTNPCVFKRHTTHNVLMAFGVLLFAVLALKSHARWQRWSWAMAACLAAGNVLLMVQGRTGYVVLAGVVVLAFLTYFGWRGVLVAIAALGLSFSVAYQVSSSLHERVNLAISSVTQWNPQVAVKDDPVGWRLEYFYHTAEIIQDHPLIGIGTGGFVQAYRARVEQAGLDVPPHPHNQYLFIMAQVGIVGLCVLLWLFVQQWRSAALIEGDGYRLLARGLVVTIALGSLFQPMLNDHTEKLFFCWLSGLLYSGTTPQSDMRT